MKSETKETIMMVGIILICLFIGFEVFKDVAHERISYCDNKYGVCNWEWNETTGTDKCKGIGQCWECIPIKPEGGFEEL